MFLNKLTDRQKGLAAAIITACTWSLLALFLKFGLKYSDSYSIVWYRMIVAFLSLLVWHIYSGQTKKLQVFFIKPGAMLVAALCLSFNYVGFMQGVHYTSPANAQIFIQFGPLLLALSGIYFFKEKLSKKQLWGLVFCLIGFSLFFLDRLNQIDDNSQNFFLGFTWIVFAAAIWAVFASLQKYLLTFWTSAQINIYIYLVATLVFVPFVDWQSLANLPISIHLLYIFLGFNTIIAYGFLSVALQKLPASQVSPILTMNPLLTLFFIILLDSFSLRIIPTDPVGIIGYVGAVVAIFGVRKVLTKPSSN